MSTELGGALRAAIESLVTRIVREQVRGIVEEAMLEMVTDPKIDQPTATSKPAAMKVAGRIAPTAQQREIARLYVEGYGYRQIEEKLVVHSQVILTALNICLSDEERNAARARIKGAGQRAKNVKRREDLAASAGAPA